MGVCNTRKTTPAASALVAARNFIDDAATPPCGDARRGIALDSNLFKAPQTAATTDSPLAPCALLHIKSAPLYTALMSIKLPLDEMTVQEKLAAMESLWEDLSRSPEAIESPTWHKDILDDRRQRVADGAAQFVD